MLNIKQGKKKSCKELLMKYKNKGKYSSGEKITCNGVGGRDVYNITAPFQEMGETIFAGRVEERDSEDSVVIFFVKRSGRWVPYEMAGQYHLQDPFISKVDDQFIFGGVETFPDPQKNGDLGWRTLFYKGKRLQDLKQFATGPDGMKDIRLAQQANGKIGVFTRPQGDPGGRGTIGYISIENLTQLSKVTINNATLLDKQFYSEEWGGVNQVHLLSNDLLGVIGHIASFDQDGNRHYYPIAFAFDPLKKIASPIEIIATRSDFPEGPAKREDLTDVLFSGGIIRLPEGKAALYVGVSDAEAHKIIIHDPFLKYE